MKPIRTYILIADGARARLLLSEGQGKPIVEVKGSELEQELKPDRELSADRPGRVHESASVTRHAIERDDLHTREKQAFAKRLAEDLDARFANGEFERLVLIAPPEAMGFLRPHLSEKVKAAVIAELVKDLTKTPNDEVKDHLEECMPV